MAVRHLLKWLPILLVLSCHASFSSAARATPSSPMKAVSLGGWLVTEGWIEPSLFDGIPNKDLLDGTQLQFESVTQQMYLSAEDGGGTIIVANRTSASGWETFTLWRITESTFQFKVFDKQFVGLSSQGDGVVAVSTDPGQSETLEIVRNADDPNRVRIKAPNGFFIQAKTDVLVTADYPESTSWGDDDPSVFLMTIVATLQGEYQVTNGYGPEKAPQVMKEHWSSFIVEDDFSFISQNGLNAVRIPVGWWIASDPNPPKPFVGGSLQALDNAFAWAGKYNIKVIVDLHAAPGSQNGNEHSASRDGSQEWGKTDANIDQTVAVIDFLTARYAQDPSLLAIELLGFASGFQGSVIDAHYYNLFSNQFNGLTVQQNIDYINNNRANDLATITRSNGPLTFVGEWVAEWEVKGATKEDYQRFAQAQLKVYGQATFGWAYWTLKNVDNHWSLEWMIKNGYITL
ncbi:probable glucan 1,3-beta-glucosidase A isoform X2 [Phoenix dactylifera]|uniref:Probable glucan 1,3-beta-glucosidase A isoform X2 n=1 Tax=Phoenix dactylifera TaxID=42345 RepID=A0A8B8J9X2_PHODC|nr:probable glucan 1,3-beta-glucosidase A isoform X2 [Phoenix dactylifera]